MTAARVKERMLFKRKLGLHSPARWKGLLFPLLLAPVNAVRPEVEPVTPRVL